MIHLSFGSTYESLQTHLRQHLESDLRVSSVFSGVKVICGTPSIEARLKQDLADQWGICSGIHFQGQASWLQHYLGCGINASNQSSDYLWSIYQALTDDFIAQYPRLANFFANDTGLGKDVVRFEFAKRVACVFAQYVNARIDWMMAWLGKAVDVSTDKALQDLELHPDYAWQKGLFQAVCSIDTHRTDRIQAFFDDVALTAKLQAEEPSSIHFFMPREFLPMAMKLFDLLDKAGRTVYLYVFNPTEAFVPGQKDEPWLLPFIYRNGVPVRDFVESLNPTADIEFLPATSQEPSLLASVQEAIRTNSKKPLPTQIDSKDQSIRVVKGPTATREVENAVDLIHTLVSESDGQYKASDILVVAPDMDALSPIVDATLKALPDEHRIAYRISGLLRHDDMMTAPSFMGLMRLVMGNVTLGELESWLELPLVTETLGLTLTDLGILKDWLVQAGFREGLTEAHLRQIHELPSDTKNHQSFDGSLDRALERLSWGFVMEDSNKVVVSDILPVKAGQAYRFKTVHDQSSLFMTLMTLSENLKTAKATYESMKNEPQELNALDQWINNLVDTFFNKKSLKNSVFAIHEAARGLRRALEGYDGLKLSAAVYVRALENHFTEQKASNNLTGEVTFANLSGFRRLPYKVIIALGLNEDSNFPGQQHFEEFNLLEIAPRAGDFNSRTEKRNVFMDLVLCAREKLILSYECGVNDKAQKQPSPVIGDLLELINANTGLPMTKWGDALTVKLALTATSPKNFQTDVVKYWRSADDRLLEAIKERARLGQEKAVSAAYEGGFAESIFPDRELSFRDIVTYMKNPESWVMKKLGISNFEVEPLSEVPIIPDQGGLAKSKLRKEWLELFEEGETPETILERQKFNPLMGAVGHRDCYFEEDLRTLHGFWSLQPNHPKTASLVIELPEGGFFKRIFSAHEVFYEAENEAEKNLSIYELNLTSNGPTMGRIRQCLMNAANMPVNLVCFPQNSKGEPLMHTVAAFDQDRALKHIQKIVSLVEATIGDLAAHCVKPKEYKSGGKTERNDVSFLWRATEDLKRQSKDFEAIKEAFEVSAPSSRGKGKTTKGTKK